MALRQMLMIISGMAFVLGLTSSISEGLDWNKKRLYNAAVENSEFVEAGRRLTNERGLFASAYAEQQQQNFQQARVIYSTLENANDQSLRVSVLFNMANTYLEQALLLDLEKEAERAMPLVELAKTTYRQLLSIDSEHWDAKFNLERAIQILPDARPLISTKTKGLRRAAVTVLSASMDENLP